MQGAPRARLTPRLQTQASPSPRDPLPCKPQRADRKGGLLSLDRLCLKACRLARHPSSKLLALGSRKRLSALIIARRARPRLSLPAPYAPSCQLIPPHQLPHAFGLTSLHVEPASLHCRPVIRLMGAAQLRRHCRLVVEVGKRAVQVERARQGCPAPSLECGRAALL